MAEGLEVSAGSVEIGYLCYHGHYCLYADPDEGGQCGSKRVGTVTLTFDDTDAPEDWTEIVSAAQASLADKYETWRNCNCDALQQVIEKAEAKIRELVQYGEKRYDQWQQAIADRDAWKRTACPHCYEDVDHEDDHLVGDKDVNAWFECPGDERPVS